MNKFFFKALAIASRPVYLNWVIQKQGAIMTKALKSATLLALALLGPSLASATSIHCEAENLESRETQSIDLPLSPSEGYRGVIQGLAKLTVTSKKSYVLVWGKPGKFIMKIFVGGKPSPIYKIEQGAQSHLGIQVECEEVNEI
jgi:hypothetical protein